MMVDGVCVCPKCNGSIQFLSDFGFWHFYCSCGWKSRVYSRRVHPDTITQEDLKESEGARK